MRHILLLSLLFTTAVYGQKRLIRETSSEIITTAYALQEKSEYEKAIEEYSKVSVNDTNYAIARYEMGTCYLELEQFDNAKNVLRALIDEEIRFDFEQDVYSNLGLAFKRGGDTVKALEIYTEGIRKFPMDFRLYYNRGLTNEAYRNYQQAFEDFIACIQRNVYFAPGHLRLGIMAAHEEHYAEATMALITYFVLDPTSERAGSVMNFIDEIADGTFNAEPKGIKFSETNPFEAINLLYKNHVALDKKYKVKLSVPTSYGKQLHFVLTNSTYNKDDQDFFNQIYLPVYQQVVKENKLDYLILLSLLSSESESAQKKIKAKINPIKEFIDWYRPVYNATISNQYFTYEGKVEKMYMVYEDSRLSHYGPLDADDQPQGNYYYYHDNGALMLKARFEHGIPVGTFEFFNSTNDKIYKKLSFMDEEGSRRVEELFYYSGERMERSTTLDETLIDTLVTYYRDGSLKETIAVKDGKRHGQDIAYFPNGKIRFIGNYALGKANGEFKNYHRNGKIESEYTYVNDIQQGKRINYYADGSIQSTYNVKDDNYDGPYEEFFPNGKLSEKGTYKKGVSVGELNYYYTNGTVENTVTLDESGRENGKGTLYDIDGKKYHETEFVSGEIKEIRFYDKKGNMSVLSERKGKKLNYQMNYPDGKVNITGKYDGNKKEGLWKYYDEYGNLSKTEKYVDGQVSDTLFTYYANGKIHKHIEFADGMKNGVYMEYSVFGDLIEEGFYINDDLDREWYEYYSDGTTENEYYYLDGELHGIQRTFYINGKVEYIQEYDNGLEILHIYKDTNGVVKDRLGEYHGEVSLKDPSNSYVNYTSTFKNGDNNGVMTVYGPNGMILTRGSYENGVRTGPWKWYYTNGKLSEEATYVNGEMDGLNTEYHSNGKLKYTNTFSEGTQQGEFKIYHENGKVKLEGTLLDGDRHGKATSYTPDGSVMLIRMYNQGVIESYSYLGTDGKAVNFIPFTKEADTMVTYHKNGKPALRCKRINGMLEGPYMSYYENGQMFENENFMYDENHGRSINYYMDGKVMADVMYDKGEKVGIEKLYFPNGKIHSEQQFVLGVAHGSYKEYSAEGKLILTIEYYDGEIISVTKH